MSFTSCHLAIDPDAINYQTSTKKMKRVERKKKKLAALIEIIELNNKDRIELESPQPYGPDGDHSKIMEMSDSTHAEKKKKFENISDSSDSSNDKRKMSVSETVELSVNSFDSPKDECNSSRHKSKKKHKSKHKDEHRESNKKKNRTKTEKIGDDDEWPTLVPNSMGDGSSYKRKSTCEWEASKERPLKMIKRHSDGYYKPMTNEGFEKPLSYSDELKGLKKDIDRNKREKEKAQKEKISDELPIVEKTDANAVENGAEELQKTVLKSVEECDLQELRNLLRARKKQLKDVPMVKLRGIGKEADLELREQRIPILPCDVQNFILFSQLGRDSPRFPKWVELKKFNRISKTIVLVVEGVSAYDFFSTESNCPMLQKMSVKAEMVSPFCYTSSIVEELCAVALTSRQRKELEKRFGKEICPEALLTDRVIKVLRSAFSISSIPKAKNEEVEKKITVPSTDKFPRTELLLSAWQLIEEGYPLPYGSSSNLGDRYPDYVMTKDEYAEVTPSSPMWAVDCEMCLTRAGNELTRVSVVDEQHKPVYESFCLPPNPIKDYLTEFSGITPKMLMGVTTRLEDIQRDLRALFPPDVILVGQSLGGDLHALKMMHPYVIDTSVIFNLTGNRRHKSKLSRLSMEFLNEAIQQRGAEGHDSIEDSLAALKLVQHKLTKSIEYGDAVLSGLKEDTNYSTSTVNTSYPEHHANEFDDLKIEVGPVMATSLFKHITMEKKSIAVVAQEETLCEYSAFIAAANKENRQLVRMETTNSNLETIEATFRECKNASFTLAHVILGDEEDVTHVDSWVNKIFDSPPFNSLLVIIFAGSHSTLSNGACFATIKKPNLKLKPRKAE